MTYEEAIQFWFGRINYEQKSPHVGDFKLGRMRQLLDILGNPQERLRILHVAGSKGKGSTSAILASILQADNYRIGLFTSPHLVAVEERIQVDRQSISQRELATLLTEIRARTSESFAHELTFFEIGTALGFLHFVRRRVDFAIVEVGLGGRFDSTNVCRPLQSIITSISFDHTQMLGNTLAKIAFEKAGIIKPTRPTISGVRNPDARSVIVDTCRVRQSPLCQLDDDFRYTYEPARIDAEREQPSRVHITTRRNDWPNLPLNLIGEHQARNAAVALAVIEKMREQGVSIADRAIADGFANVHWPARLEIVARRPFVLLDCAHNVASAQALVQALDESFHLPNAKRTLIFGGNRDKDLAGMLALLAPQFDHLYLTTFQSNARCATSDQLLEMVPAEKRSICERFDSSIDAWQRARAATQPSDLICVTGSVFLAGELRPVIRR